MAKRIRQLLRCDIEEVLETLPKGCAKVVVFRKPSSFGRTARQPGGRMAFAHSRNKRGEKHDLATHLKEVAEVAAQFAGKFDASTLGHWAGLWHDLGKFHPDFQAYLESPEARRGPDHKGAGAILAWQHLDSLCFLIKGHHGGLSNRADLKMWLGEKAKEPRIDEALRIARQEIPELEPTNTLNLPAHVHSELEAELFLRLLFSALTDADFLDTERHFSSEKAETRRVTLSLETLWNRLEEDQRRLTGKRTDPVNRVRHDVYRACLRAADQPPGFFRLTVPTGGGKTRSGLAFGLRHAVGSERSWLSCAASDDIESSYSRTGSRKVAQSS